MGLDVRNAYLAIVLLAGFLLPGCAGKSHTTISISPDTDCPLVDSPPGTSGRVAIFIHASGGQQSRTVPRGSLQIIPYEIYVCKGKDIDSVWILCATTYADVKVTCPDKVRMDDDGFGAFNVEALVPIDVAPGHAVIMFDADPAIRPMRSESFTLWIS